MRRVETQFSKMKHSRMLIPIIELAPRGPLAQFPVVRAGRNDNEKNDAPSARIASSLNTLQT